MRNTFDFIRSLKGQGISVSLVGDLLKIEPKALITDEIRTEVKNRKADLTEALLRVEPVSLRGGSQTASTLCWRCRHYDGKGAAWPGKCRYFEQPGHDAREIDFNVVDPNKGCGFFKGAVVVAPQVSNQGVAIPAAAGTGKMPRKPVKLPSPAATAWLLEHRDDLREFGWTASELWRRNKSKQGIAWLVIWDKPSMTVDLSHGGVIQFGFPNNGRQIRQTARPLGLGYRGLSRRGDVHGCCHAYPRCRT